MLVKPYQNLTQLSHVQPHSPLAGVLGDSGISRTFKDFMSNLHNVEDKVQDTIVHEKDMSAVIPDVAKIGLEVEAVKNVSSELIRSTKELLNITV